MWGAANLNRSISADGSDKRGYPAALGVSWATWIASCDANDPHYSAASRRRLEAVRLAVIEAPSFIFRMSCELSNGSIAAT